METHVTLDAATIALAVVVGAPLMAILASLAWSRRRPPAVRALAGTALVALLCTPGILVIDSTTVPTLWTAARHIPLLRLVRPQRLSMFAWLIAAGGAGVWIAAWRDSWRRWAVGVLATAGLLPAVWLGTWTSVIPGSPLSGRHVPARGDNVAVVAGSRSSSLRFGDLAFPTVWQAEAGFSFRVANAYVGSFPPPLPLAVRRMEFGRPLDRGQRATVLRWLRSNEVRAVLVVRPREAVVASIGELLHVEPKRLQGAVLFEVPR